MGLTIHYELEFKGSEKEVKEKLRQVKQIAENLPFKKVGPFWSLDYSKDFNNDAENKRCGGKDIDDYRWAKIVYQPRREKAEEYKGWTVMLWAGKGCESTDIGLISKDGKNWTGSSFTKTQYAEHFVRAHLLVIKILDVCKGLGILKEVSDEGHYWESRDLKKLGSNINESTAFIEKIGKMLKGSWPEDQIVSPIDKSKNYVKEVNNERDQG